ncbi:MAG: DUF1292 domain-containing protein [Clostridiales bacterium]|nr:DUF1292 domain-containing protein [Clostridiales bacterium]
MSEERDDILVLIDEKGEEVEFEYLDTIEMDNNEYAVLLPVDDEDEDEEAETEEVVILKLDKDDNGEDSFVSVDDEAELQKVFAVFKKKVQEQYNFED